MAIGSARKHISTPAPRPHMGTSRNPQAHAKAMGTDLLLFTGKRPKWSIIGAMSVMTMDWQDF